MTLKLKSAHIENFKSLGDITLNFKNLTILVGANSSGKSNCLESLYFLSAIVENGSPPPSKAMSRVVKVGSQKDINIQTFFKEYDDNEEQANYQVSLSLKSEKFSQEILCVNGIKVIDVKEGKGNVKDENGENVQPYNSKTGDLALKSAGNFGNKPFTSRLAEFIENWQFYDLDPDMMRNNERIKILKKLNDVDSVPILESSGSELEDVLCYWSENKTNKLEEMNNDLSNCLGIKLKSEVEDEDTIIKVKEKDQLEVSLSSMSDGTLRILAYYTLLYEDKIPPLMGIEEPERNLHPRILRDIAAILKKLSEKTQIIITTHSSQLLDCFTYDDIMSDVAVILLRKKNESGTQAIALDELSKRREDLKEWMQDFGVGSAVYDSHLLDEILDKQNA